jgi:hypothetical protein
MPVLGQMPALSQGRDGALEIALEIAMARLEIDDGKIAVRGLQLEAVHRGTGPLLLLLQGAGGIDPDTEFLNLLARHFEVVAPSHPRLRQLAAARPVRQRR